MSRSTDIHAFNSIRLTLGQSLTSVGLTALAGQLAISIKLLSGGTLEIGGQSQTHGTMYPMSATEIVSADNAGQVWLYASGATCVVAILRGRSAGDWT